jgi:hypothetical protein
VGIDDQQRGREDDPHSAGRIPDGQRR